MSSDLLDPRLLEALDQGLTVVTQQRSQARYLRFAYARFKQINSVTSWTTPAILTWDDWILHLAREIMWSGYVSSAGQRKLLSAGQEQLIWEQIIDQRSENLLLDNLSGTARRARQAWGLIQAWRLPDPKTAQFPNTDVKIFSGWMREYFSMTTKRAWLDQARIADSVSPAIKAGAIAPPDATMLFGFEEFTPQQRLLLKTLEDLGTTFHLAKQHKIKGEMRRLAFADHESELEAAARWVRMVLARDDPGVTAVLIPDLDRNLNRVFRIFDDVLSPGSSLPTSSLIGRPYSISIDRPFYASKYVDGALSILRFALNTSLFNEVSVFLRSPFVRSAGAEQPMRSRFELWLRNNNIDSVHAGELSGLLSMFSQRRDPDAAQSVLSAILTSLEPLIENSRGQHSMPFWAAIFRDLLNAAGWPGDANLNTVELQTVEKFQEVLDELAGLDFLVPVCNSDRALTYLNRIIRGTGFRPRLPESPVQIMQPEQAFGLRFDQVWVAGWHSQNWPAAPRSNPFLPVEWQKQYNIPGSSSDIQLRHSVAITEDLCGSASEVTFSFPQLNGDESLVESPLIQKVPAQLEADAEIMEITDYCEVIRAATDLEEFTDVQGPSLNDATNPSGGTTVFRLQSQCPFKAFAEQRLGVSSWNIPRPGVSAMDKGNHLHKAMEFIWAKIGNSETLAEVFATEHLENQVYREVELALGYQDRKRVRKLSDEVHNLEQQRLVRQVLEILAIERQRPPFEVMGHEVVNRLQVGDLNVDIRIDRVDDVAGKGQVLFDYKLGHRTANMWKQPRMEEPQLPLYALAYGDAISAIAFINGKPGAVGVSGVGNSADIAGGIVPVEKSVVGKDSGNDWAAQLDSWRQELEQLAQEFTDGRAEVDPVSSNTCRYCDLKSFCRIGEHRLIEEEEDQYD